MHAPSATMARPPPYPGLASYGDGQDEAELFFGRELECDLIVANLYASRTTVLYGPGGVGKSSLLHAGVVHRLREDGRGDGDEQGTIVVIADDWTGDPAERLVEQIRAQIGDDAGTDGNRAAGDAAERARDAVAALAARGHGSLLLILDQFEDYMRLHPDPRGMALDEVVCALARDPRLPVRTLIAVREDRLADLDRFAGRIPKLLGNVLRLGPLSPGAALEAIEGPVERSAAWAREGRGGAEISLEDGLATAVRDELVALSGRRRAGAGAAADGKAPEPRVEASFLQLVMRRLWEEDVADGGGTVITLATLKRLGGAETIVATHLDGALGRLSEDEQALAEKMLRFLVTPSGASACLTAHDLADFTESSEREVEALAETLARAPARILRSVAAPAGASKASGYEVSPVLAEPALDWRVRHRTRRVERRARRLLLALVAMTSVAIALVAYALDPKSLQRMELAAVDARFDIRGTQAPDPRIALVTIDDAALGRLAEDGFRATFARALTSIETARPRAVAVNILFARSGTQVADRSAARNGEPAPAGAARRELQRADGRLLGAVRGPLHDRLVLTTDRLSAAGTSRMFGRDSETYSDHNPTTEDADSDGDAAEPAVGYQAFLAEPEGAAGPVRRMDRDVSIAPGDEPLDHFAIVAARLAQRPGRSAPKVGWIDYRGGPGTYPSVAFYDVVERRPQALAALRDKIVVIGTSELPSTTSAAGSGAMLGHEIQANAIATALDDFPLRSAGAGAEIALIVAFGLLPLGLVLWLRPGLALPAVVAAAAVLCVAAQLAFDAGHVVAVAAPLASLALTTIGLMGALAVRGRLTSPPSR